MIAKTSSNQELRKFGLIFLGYFIGISLLLTHIHHHKIPMSVIYFATAFILIIILQPKALYPLHTLYRSVLNILQWINSRILLGLIYYTLFTLIAYFRKLLKKDNLHLSTQQSIKSYRLALLNEGKNDMRKPY